MTKRYGIDLGTTYSTISWYDDSRQEVKPLPLESEDGETTSLRSVVYYPPEGTTVVGEVAWNTRKQDPGRVIVGIKRKMGEEYQTEPIDGRRRTPQEVSADILQTLKDNAEIEMGEAVEDVVITVPAYFGERQCAATMESAKKVGLNVVNILSEPHAAAVAYSIEQNTSLTGKHVLVYDLGGGTFDVTLIRPVIPADFASAGGSTQNLQLNTLCKDGNRELGGLDWDEILIDIVADKCMDQFEVDPRLDARNAAVLHDNCEKAKRALSKKSTEMVVADLQGHMVEVSREEFEERASGLVLQTQMRLEQVLADAEANHGIERDQIDVLLCGGSTRMPMVRDMISQVFTRAPLEYRNPQLLVACGAAYVAHAVDDTATIPLPGPAGEATEDRAVRITADSITDITCHAVGIQVIREDEAGERRPYNAIVLERGTLFGERRQFVTETLFDNQTEVCIRLFEGDTEAIDECVHLVDFRIEGLPGGRPRGRPIRTTLWFGSNGIIKGNAVDMETNTEIVIHYDRWSAPADPAPVKPVQQQNPVASEPMSMPQVPQQPVVEPVAQQPVVQQPVVEQPVVQQPVVQQPVVEQPVVPVVDQPVVQQPVVEQPVVPVVDQPVVQQPVVPVVDQPVVQQPVVEQPVVPVVDQPVVQQPVAEQPVVPVVDQPVVEQPVVDQPVVEQPVVEPVVPVIDQAIPVMDLPVVEQPVAEVPVVDPQVPVVDQPVVEPLVDGPVVDAQGPFDPADPFGNANVGETSAQPAVPDVPVVQPEAQDSENPDSDNDEPPRETPRPLKLY